MKKLKPYLILVFTLALTVPVLVFANAHGTSLGCPPGQLCNPINVSSIQALVSKILDIVSKIGIPVVVFFLIYVGFLFVTARGNETILTQAKKALMWTLIGGLILIGAQGLSKVICSTVDEISGQSTCR